MILNFYLKPITLNTAVKYRPVKTKTGKLFIQAYKSKQAKEFENEFQKQWQQFAMEAKAFKDSFNENKHGVKVSITYQTPELYTQKGVLKKTSGDIDNWNKYFIDCCFDRLGINDAFILELHCFKMYGDEYKINCKLEVI